MFCVKRLVIVTAAALALTSCASWRPHAPLLPPPAPLPALLLAPCPAVPALEGDDMDAIALTLKRTWDAYGVCSGLHAGLVDWLERTPARGSATKER